MTTLIFFQKYTLINTSINFLYSDWLKTILDHESEIAFETGLWQLGELLLSWTEYHCYHCTAVHYALSMLGYRSNLKP